ncbi:MAG: hypothetical protein M2R45_01987 [Verrucomicrobia subdivision 3 bacterium]|nr:hypothetical protein [Limisphaerales bacterium]MCS1414805.1 hypothetical protein [Limisphaerales bacterium]
MWFTRGDYHTVEYSSNRDFKNSPFPYNAHLEGINTQVPKPYFQTTEAAIRENHQSHADAMSYFNGDYTLDLAAKVFVEWRALSTRFLAGTSGAGVIIQRRRDRSIEPRQGPQMSVSTRPFQHGPEGFHAVRVHRVAHIFGVIDSLMGESRISCCLVRAARRRPEPCAQMTNP